MKRLSQTIYKQHIQHIQKRNFIQIKSILKCADGSGAVEVECLTVPKSRRGLAKIGKEISVAVKTVKPGPETKVSKKQICRAIIIGMRMRHRRLDGSWYQSGENLCVLLDPKGNVMGNRVNAPIPMHLRGHAYSKLRSLGDVI